MYRSVAKQIRSTKRVNRNRLSVPYMDNTESASRSEIPRRKTEDTLYVCVHD